MQNKRDRLCIGKGPGDNQMAEVHSGAHVLVKDRVDRRHAMSSVRPAAHR